MNCICCICICIFIGIWVWIPIITTADNRVMVCSIGVGICLFTSYISFPPIFMWVFTWICPSNIRTIPIIRAVTLSYPRCINAAAARAFPSLFSAIRRNVVSIVCRCSASSCSCGWTCSLDFISSIHIYLQSDVGSSSLLEPYCSFSSGRISSNELWSVWSSVAYKIMPYSIWLMLKLRRQSFSFRWLVRISK